ncbi:RHS repeat-associated core domain-containing protein [Corallococcus macrosporus]|nr:RHS repeat-associated core domain-containing protein [Corallococcus macrosporus]
MALTAVGVAIAQTAGEPPSAEEVQSAVDKATRVPFPELGGARAAGAQGEVTLGSMRSLYESADVTVQSPLGPVSFVRYYGLDTRDNTADYNKRPRWTPFGSMRADTSASYRAGTFNGQCGAAEDRNNCRGGLRWWHNFESWVEYKAKERPCLDEPRVCAGKDKEYDVTWTVHAPDGRLYSFPACSLDDIHGNHLSQCYARNLSDPGVKLVLLANGTAYGGAFVLYTPAARYVYDTPFGIEPQEPGWVNFRLSYILAPEQLYAEDGITPPGDACLTVGPNTPCQRRLATIHYGPVCLSDKTTVRNPLENYVTHVDVAGAGTLLLQYHAVYLRDRKQMVNTFADGGTDGKYIPPKECVLSKILLLAPEGDSTPAREVASYGYSQGLFEEDVGTTTQTLGGLLSDVVVSPGSGPAASIETRLHYEYTEAVLPKDGGPSLQPLRTFRVLRNGLLERELVVDASDGSYVTRTQVGDTKVDLWADNNGIPQDGGFVPYCSPGNFTKNGVNSAGQTIVCRGDQWQYQQAESVLLGNGSGALVAGVQQGSHLGTSNTNPNGPLVSTVVFDGGTFEALPALPRKCSWAVEAYNPCGEGVFCPKYSSLYAYAPAKQVDTRGNKLVLESNLAPLDAGVPSSTEWYPVAMPHVEVHVAHEGASLDDGSDALQTTYFNYAYVGHFQQKVKDEYGYSVLETTNGSTYRIRRHYDVPTGRLTGVVQMGYTLQFNAASNSWAPALRHVGTFYRTRYSCGIADADAGTLINANEGEAWGRVVEVSGPCLVTGLDATACAPGQPSVPLTQYEYHPATAAPRLAGRLAVRRVFSRTAGDGTCNMPDVAVEPKPYVETRYDDYDVQGRLTQWRNENGVKTKYVYSGDKLVESRVADGNPLVAVTTYGYDNGEGTGNWVHYPDGRYEVQCFRKNTAPGVGCSGGVLTDKLQWTATARFPSAWDYTERTDYKYAANGQLVGEEVLDSSGVPRRKRYFEGDPLGRTTYEATGSALPEPSSDSRYHQVSLFDMEGNRVGLGLPYQPSSSPLEPLCGGFGPQSTQANALPASPLCKAFEYDRLNRLSRLMEPLDTQGSQTATTCLSYDGRGNLAGVGRAGPNQACAPNVETSVRYVHDDFGNLVQVVAPWARALSGWAGEYHYAYDAAGNLTVKQTPTMAHSNAPAWVEYNYDAMRRVLTAQAASKNWANPQTPNRVTLYAYGYDGQVTPPSMCPGGAGNPDGTPNVKGRAQVLTDSFGDTWYHYDVHGNPRAHWRVRASGQPARTQACSRGNTSNTPNRWFYFDQAGRMINEVLPGGRPLTYLYYGNDTGLSHRVAEVRAATWDGSRWATMMTLIKDIQWEPYGGIKSYAVNTHLSTGMGTTPWRYVDYLRTAPATVPLSQCNDTNIVSGNDLTGRLKAITVSTEAARNVIHHGDIYKRVYTWKADQVVREDTCVLETANVAPETVKYEGAQGEAGYDTRGQLRHVTGTVTNRPHDLRTYTYDALGNRLSERRGDFVFQLGYAPEQYGMRGELPRTRSVSQCTAGDASCQQSTALTAPTEHYGYDDDGRLSEKTLNSGGAGGDVLTGLTFGTGLDAEHAALGTVYKSVAENFVFGGDTWEYFYDAQGRRRLKLYSTGAREEYFYDKTALLEDWSISSLTSTQPDSVRDEYIWLGSRPVAFFKTRVSSTGGRVPDFTGTCERFSDDVEPACGVYFPVTDVLGKPVLMLDGAGLVTGVADYDPFGHVNRVSHPADSPHPSTERGAQRLLLETSTALPALRSGIKVQVRGRFTYLMGKAGSEAFLTDGAGARLTPATSMGTSIPDLSGRSVATPWVNAASTVRVYFKEPTTTLGEPTEWGASLEGLEYRRFQTGATPVWLPLRLPGQYHDAETGLFENWNRYYDPSIGRYLGPDPLAFSPQSLLSEALAGRGVSPYAYANNNPVNLADPEGLQAAQASNPELWQQFLAGAAAVGAAVSDGVAWLGARAVAVVSPVMAGVAGVLLPTDAHAPNVQDAPAVLNEGKKEGAPTAQEPEAGAPARTQHGEERAEQARSGDDHRQVGDANRVVGQGRQFTDSETGNTIHVSGDRVVVTNGQGQIVTQFRNTRANTQSRIQNGRWIPK